MKQHITLEQLNEFYINELAEKINDDYFSELVDSFMKAENARRENLLIEKLIGYFDIGKMIEIIERKDKRYIQLSRDYKTDYEVSIRRIGKRFTAKELVDALWEAVKYVLEEHDDKK